MSTFELTDTHWQAMEKVQNGADVYALATAAALREVQKNCPELINIVPAVNPPRNGAEQQPYFGAILTRKGKDLLAKQPASVPAPRT